MILMPWLVAFLSAALTPLGDRGSVLGFITEVTRLQTRLAKLDLKAAELSAKTCSVFDSLKTGNQVLRTLSAECDRLDPLRWAFEAPALAMLGQAAAAAQDTALAAFQAEASSQATLVTRWGAIVRAAPDMCGVPGPLEWPAPPRPVLELEEAKSPSFGGAAVFVPAMRSAYWAYRSPNVRAL